MILKKRIICFILTALAALLLPGAALAAQFTGGASPEAVPPEGANAELSITIYNDGAAAMENIAISQSGSALFSTTTGAVIEPGSSLTFMQTVTIPATLVGTPIRFDINWTENGEAKSGTCDITVLNSGLTGADGTAATMLSASREVSSSQASQGEVITLTYTLTNNGVVPISGVSITDRDIAGKDPIAKDITVEPGIPYVITYDFTMGSSTVASAPVIAFTQTDGTAGSITLEEKTLGMIKSRISVAVEQGVATEEGQSFSLSLTNNGNQKISKITVKDELGNSVSQEPFALAIGESTSLTYTVPTSEMRNVVFYIEGTDATGTAYNDNTKTFEVRKYIDPSLIGISFSAAVTEPLDASGSISIDFTVENNGKLVMQNLVLSEAEYGTLYLLDSVPQGTETINQRMDVGSPRDLTFTLDIEDPSGNLYTYTAYITADFVGVEPAASAAPDVEIGEGDLVSDVGGTISNALRTVLVVLIVLTCIAGVALIVLGALEREERKRAARRRAQRERMLRQQALEQGFSEEPLAPASPELSQTKSSPRPTPSGWTDISGETRRITTKKDK